ncbi:MAG: hypothetical protein QOC55_988, partial [Thermoleophilaceae bacterium]|nr:hypothetical protein [Thermoleophilaceae bacterium]
RDEDDETRGRFVPGARQEARRRG